jgi:hypothetical protein
LSRRWRYTMISSPLIDRAELQVARAWNLYRAGRSTAATTAALPDLDACARAGPFVALNAANLLVLLDDIGGALELAYAVACLHPNDISVLNRYVAIGLRAKAMVPHLFSSSTAQPGTVVALENAGGRQTLELTREDAQPTRWRSILADRFLGLEVGSTVELEGQEWRITGIEGKHSRLVGELLASLHTRFPGEAMVRALPVDEKGTPQVTAELEELAMRQAKATAAYQEEQCSIHGLATLISQDVIDVWYLIIRRQFGEIIHVTSRGLSTGVEAKLSGVVLDALSCMALHETALLQTVRERFGHLAVTQSTLDALVRARDERRFAVFAGMGVLARRGDDVVVERTGAEQIKSASAMFGELVEWLRSHVEVLGVPLESADGREALGELYSESAADSILVAKAKGWILVAEDARVVEAGGQRFGVEGVSSIGIVRALRAGDDLRVAEVAMAKMSTWGYPIDVDVAILMRAVALDGWNGGPHVWGVLRALAGSGAEARENAGVAVDFTRAVMVEPVVGGSRERVLIAALDGIRAHGLWETFQTVYEEREHQLWRLLPDQGRMVRATLVAWKKARGIE